MKKIYYIFLGMILFMFSLSNASAKEIPVISTALSMTKDSTSGTISTSIMVKNNDGNCNGTGIKNGKIYVYINNSELNNPTNISAVYRDYKESTNNYSETKGQCNYDGVINAIICDFGRTNNSPHLENYSDCNDEMKITFKTKMINAVNDCNIKVSVKGEPIDYNNGNPTSLSNGTIEFNNNNFSCNKNMVKKDSVDNKTTDLAINDNNSNTNTFEPAIENPNTADTISVYFIAAIISFLLMFISIKPKKKIRAH